MGGLGILERENAAVLNATIHAYASFVFSEIENALRVGGLQGCPIFISSNDGSMVPLKEAVRFPIQSVASGPANSMLGASYLGLQKSSSNDHSQLDPVENSEKILILDVGGTTTDAGVLMTNGFPRQASAYTMIAGVQVNSSMPDVSSIGLGGGSIVKTDAEGTVTAVGPESVGNQLTTKALCFGGNVLTLTDVAVAAGDAPDVGTVPVSIRTGTILSAQELIKAKFEELIVSAKTQPKPLAVAVVGGGALLCPKSLYDSTNIISTTLASVANAVGAACAQLSATADTIFEAGSSRSRDEEAKLVKLATERATQKCIGHGATRETVRIVERQVMEMAYIAGKIRVIVRVVGNFDASSARKIRITKCNEPYQLISKAELRENAGEGRRIVYEIQPGQDKRLVARNNILSYYPSISNKTWALSEIDIEWLSIGCYILGCGGGGSPHLPSIAAKQLLRQGKALSIVNAQDLPRTAILPPIGLLGSPMVSIERPGGNLCADALDNMLAHQGVNNFDASLCVEIGGSNGLSPLLSGRPDRGDRPMVDGDLMGRAFPTFEMISPYLFNEDINHLLPVSVASGTGTNMILKSAQSTAAVDSILRACCVTMGCAAGVVSRPLTAEEFVNQGLLHTHSAAWRIGRAVKSVQSGCWTGDGTPAEAVVEECGGPNSAKILFKGKIVDVSNRLVKGHSVGQLIVEGYSPSLEAANVPVQESAAQPKAKTRQQLSISFKNENLIAELLNGRGQSEKVCGSDSTLLFTTN